MDEAMGADGSPSESTVVSWAESISEGAKVGAASTLVVEPGAPAPPHVGHVAEDAFGPIDGKKDDLKPVPAAGIPVATERGFWNLAGNLEGTIP